MILKYSKYAIATKQNPIEFICRNFDTTNRLEEAMFNDNRETTEKIIQDLDDPEEFEILPVSITYEI